MRFADRLLAAATLLVLCAATAFAYSYEEIGDITLERDVVYAVADGYELTLDIAYANDPDTLAPAVVHIHGGAWRNGRKSADRALRFAKAGFVGISINYRLSGVANFPAGVHDCKRAIRWVRAHAAKYGIDPQRIGVVGESAGGHLVALLGTSGDDPYLEGHEGDIEYSSSVNAVVDHYGPIDFLRMEDAPGRMRHLTPGSPESLWFGRTVTEVPDMVRMANPITYIDANDPPVLIIHGEADGIVIIQQSEYFYEALRKAGVQSEFLRVKNADHGYPPNPKSAKISPSREEIFAREMEWFRRVLGR